MSKFEATMRDLFDGLFLIIFSGAMLYVMAACIAMAALDTQYYVWGWSMIAMLAGCFLLIVWDVVATVVTTYRGERS